MKTLRFAFVLLLVCTIDTVFSQTTLTYSAPGSYNWTPPAGVTSVTLTMWGGGGAGISSYASGGGGAFLQTTAIPVTFGTTYIIVVGAGAISNQGGASAFQISGGGNIVYVEGGNTNGISGGAASTGPYVSVSNKGGNGALVADFYSSAGGGAAGSSCGPGGDGSQSSGAAGQCGAGSGGDPNGNTIGGAPGGGGAGGFFIINDYGGNGKVILTYTCNPGNPGSIGNGHTITYPPEFTPDSITNIVSPDLATGVVIGWQQSTDNTNFTAAKTPTNIASYRFDQDSLKVTYYYRRGTNACVADVNSLSNWSNTIQIKVLTSKNGRNGGVTGYVQSRNGTRIIGRKVYAQNLTSLKGRALGYLDSAFTDNQGKFTIDSIFYGDQDYGDPASVKFKIYPDTTGQHLYSPDTAEVSLSTLHPTYDLTGQPFRDTTTFAVKGQVTQVCSGCLNARGNPTNIVAPIDSIHITGIGIHNSGTINEKDSAITGYLDPPGQYGSYGLIFQEPDIYTITPNFHNHKFQPVDSVFHIDGNVNNINFIDTTTHLITGFFGAGCGDVIGKAVLEFDDTLPKGFNGLPRASIFRKQVKTGPDGHYAIRLPARNYKVKIISVTISDPLDNSTNATTVQSFFLALPITSLMKDITDTDGTLDLIYQRPPHIAVTGLIDSSSTKLCSAYQNYAIWPQPLKKEIAFKVYQGPVSRGCPTDSGFVYLTTDVSNMMGHYDKDTIAVHNGNGIIELLAAQPNPLINGGTNTYSKYFSATYADPLGREVTTDTMNPPLPIIVVTGVAIDSSAKTFVTVSPQLPFLVLHDPPGNHSFSSWEQGVTNEQEISFEAEQEASVGGWLEVKLGLDVILGIFLEQEDKFWASINASVDISDRTTNTDETVITTKTTNAFSTSDDQGYVGPDDDLFYGAAMNIKYTEGNEIDWDSVNCTFTKKPILVFGPDGIKTSFVYTLSNIRDVQIPKLREAAEAKPDSADYFENQAKVWEQVLENNEFNKKNAGIDSNISFSSGVGFNSSTTIENSTKNSYQFNLTIDSKIATEVGVEIAGSGVKGGVNVGFRMSNGGSVSSTHTVETTTDYTLSDNNPGDLFSVNVKRDPVYGTPMFETIAGESNCPHEENTVALDNSVITANTMVLKNIKKDTANFTLYLGNLSIDPNPREYILFLNAATNPGGATVLIGGNSSPDGVSYFIPHGGNQPVTISVIRNSASGIYNYDNLEFILSDNCFPPTVQTFLLYPHQNSRLKISADFLAPVSNANIVTPLNNWVANMFSNNTVPVTFDGYDTSHLASISLQYNLEGTGTWKNAFTVIKSKLGATSTTSKWRISKVPDGKYNLRLMIQDKFNNIVYSEVVAGTIARNPPALYGVPKPSNGIYKTGTQISYSYTENIDNNKLTDSTVHFKDLTTNTPIAVQLSAYANRLVIIPKVDISPYTGHLLRVIVDSIYDFYGNARTHRDTAYFKVAATIFGTGPDALNLSIGKNSIYEDDKGSMDVHFTRNSASAGPIAIYYNISGNAGYPKDYTVTYKSNQTSITGINGSDGVIVLPKDSSQVTLFIHPVNDSSLNANKKVIITLATGGGYAIGNSYTVTGNILDHNLPAPIITASKSTDLCPGDSVILSTKDKINGNPVKLKWSTGAKSKSITVSKAGVYTVTATDANGFKGYSAPVTVTVNCGSPSGLGVVVLNKNRAVASWNVSSCAVRYCLKVRAVGTSSWKTDTLTTAYDTLKGLLPNTTYEWQVATICRYPKIIISTFTNGSNFTTPTLATDVAVKTTADYSRAAAGDGFTAAVHPNPATTEASLQLTGLKNNYTVQIINMQGVVLWQKADQSNVVLSLPVGILKRGTYMVIVNDGIHTGRLKLIKQ